MPTLTPRSVHIQLAHAYFIYIYYKQTNTSHGLKQRYTNKQFLNSKNWSKPSHNPILEIFRKRLIMQTPTLYRAEKPWSLLKRRGHYQWFSSGPVITELGANEFVPFFSTTMPRIKCQFGEHGRRYERRMVRGDFLEYYVSLPLNEKMGDEYLKDERGQLQIECWHWSLFIITILVS